MKPVVKIKFGSHLYGTNTETSDIDYKSVHIPDYRDIILQRVQDSVNLSPKRTKAENEKNTSEDKDDESYSLQKYLRLLAEGQTVAIDMLFAPAPEFTSDIWGCIQRNNYRLLTKKSASFVGYCRTQANKYGIKGSRMSAAKEAMDHFAYYSGLEEFGPLGKVGDIGDDDFPLGEHTKIEVKETTPGRFETYFVCCNRMVGFKNTIKEAYNIYKRIYDEYGERARQALNNENIDWKALSHAVRVGQEAMELLEFHRVTFPLPNAKHILDIKQGKLPYAQVAEEIEHLLSTVEDASRVSTLRDEPDQQWIDDLVYSTYKNQGGSF
jgi:hypothetical protein